MTIFHGYSTKSKAYKLLYLKTMNIFVSQDVASFSWTYISICNHQLTQPHFVHIHLHYIIYTHYIL